MRSLDPNVKMNPPLRAEPTTAQALIDGAARRDDRARSRPTTRRTRAHEKEVPFEEAPFGVTGLETAFAALYTHLVEPGLLPLETLLERMSAGPGARLRARAAADRGRRAGEPRPARPRARPGGSSEGGFRSRSANSWLLGADAQGAGRG